MASGIPPEVLANIFRCMVDGSYDLTPAEEWPMGSARPMLPYPKDRITFAATVPLVCRLFRALSVPILWENLVVRSERDLALLENLSANKQVNNEQGLGYQTRRLELALHGPYDPLVAGDLIRRMPRLRILILHNCTQEGHTPCSTIPNVLLDAIVRPEGAIEHIEFRSHEELPTYSQLIRISKCCTSLKYLHLENMSFMTADFDDKPATLNFPEITSLSLGPAQALFCDPIIGPTVGQSALLGMVAVFSAAMPVMPRLQRLDLLGDIPWRSHFVGQLCGKIETLVCTSAWSTKDGDRNIESWSRFANLRHLYILVELAVDPLPTGLRALEIVVVIEPEIPEISAAHLKMRSSSRAVLSKLLRAHYPALKYVMLGLRAEDENAESRDMVTEYSSRFRHIGVQMVNLYA